MPAADTRHTIATPFIRCPRHATPYQLPVVVASAPLYRIIPVLYAAAACVHRRQPTARRRNATYATRQPQRKRLLLSAAARRRARAARTPVALSSFARPVSAPVFQNMPPERFTTTPPCPTTFTESVRPRRLAHPSG